MGNYRTIFSLVAIMAAVALVIGGATINILYDTAFEQKRADLVRTVQNQARLMEAVARFDLAYSTDYPRGAFAATISQVEDAHSRYEWVGGTGEFTLARREDDEIVFILSHRHHALDIPMSVALESSLAEPMRRALAGESGTVVGLDYRGVTVLAAHEPVAILNLGIVAKVDLAEVRAPFVRAGGIVFGIGFVIIAAGIALFLRVGNPMVRRIQESEEIMRRSVLDAPIPIMMHAEDGEVLMISKRWTELSGYSPADIPTIPEWAERAYGADSERMQDRIGRLYELDEPIESERNIITASGERRIWHFRFAPLGRLPDGRRFVISMGVDITERKQAEAELQEKERQYRQLFNQMLDGFAIHEVICDEKGVPCDYRFLDVNPAFEGFTGLRGDDIIGKTVLEVLPNTEHKWIKTYGEVALTGKPIHFENYSQELDKYFEVVAFRPKKGQFAVTFTDITDRKAAEAERERLEAQLRQAQKLEAVGTLAGGIAHDFNNILAGMIGYAHLAIEAVPAKSQVRGDLYQVLKGIDRATILVKQILSFSRRGDAERHLVEIGRVVEEALDLLRATIPATIEIHSEIDRGAGTVVADATQLQQVVMNLCTNAADAIGPGPGVIEIALARVELGGADTATRPDLAPGSYVKLSVSDSGVGMDAATRARVFEPFFTTKEPGKGTGLGMAVVHGILRDHGGAIELDSAPGRGTTFTVLLPRTEAVDRDGTRVDREVPRGRERILLIDDEAAIVCSEKRLLERLGYKVKAVMTGVGALEVFRAAPGDFDLVITDHAMPELSGMALAQEILKLRGDMPIILCSGYTDALGEEDAASAGIREFITKPIRPDDLARAVRRALDGDV
jgi:PAS domain S-box-containing protein